MKYEVILQDEAADCGLACLAMIAAHHGARYTLQDLKKKIPYSARGMTLSAMIEASHTLGLQSRAVRTELAGLTKLKLPAILHWNFNHFVVLCEAKRGRYVTLCPFVGQRTIDPAELNRAFTGIALELQPKETFQTRSNPPSPSLFSALSKIPRIRKMLWVSVLLSVLVQAGLLVQPIILQVCIDSGVLSTSIGPAIEIGLLAFGCIAAASYARVIRSSLLEELCQEIDRGFTSALITKLLDVHYSYYVTRNGGSILTKARSFHRIREYFASGFLEAALDGLVVLLLIVALFIYNLAIGFITAFAIVGFAVYVFNTNGARKAAVRLLAANEGAEGQQVLENIRGFETIKIFCAEGRRHEMWRTAYGKMLSSLGTLAKIKRNTTAGDELIVNTARIVSLVFLLGSVRGTNLSIGAFASAVFLQNLVLTRARDSIEKVQISTEIQQRFEQSLEVFDEANEALENEEHVGAVDLQGKVSFREVTIQYAGDGRKVVDSFSLEVQPGEIVAITGPSGCGKTSLLRASLGLLTPADGGIYYDDQPLASIGVRRLRSLVGVVMQDDTLFEGSIRDNITFFDNDVNEEWMYEVSRKARLHLTVSKMPMGYQTRISERLGGLSGGERQRLFLARALYKKPKILFLDEASSHLDVNTEKSINETLQLLPMTRIIIAHRLETLAIADRVITLQGKQSGNKTSEVINASSGGEC